MSDSPDNGSDNGGKNGQPQGGQPQGGQGSQPQGGQPQGGQPQAGQPQGGQPPAGQPQGQPAQQAPVNTGPSVGDIFSRQDTLAEIKVGVATLALIGVGLGLGVLLIGGTASSSTMNNGAYRIAASAAMAAFAVAPVASGLVAQRQASQLVGVPDNLKFATAAVTGAAGTLAFVLITYIFSILTLDTGSSSAWVPELGDAFLPIVLIAIGGAVTATGIVWAIDNLSGQ